MRCYTRNSDLESRVMDDELFLVSPATGAIFCLNATGAALWNMLTEPMPLDDIVIGFRDAFADIDAGQIERDITGIVKELVRRGVVEHQEQAGAGP